MESSVECNSFEHDKKGQGFILKILKIKFQLI